ncbi:hypothetical protein BTO04_01620 [Polaribacter sp. SA4-10]|uniref:glycosyltransferase n=1 Tax=Polaribacter sp. SA4-10 TaxID=754397 RepID=UPI000B3CC35E|nr:glycosyltransferase [Polaribacter sp. SA4-10]ARV05469.1 hypothetical protein BTO04_01620 [Polaribacter sp. SA4-10]
MKKGIIIVFSNDENKIDQDQFINLFIQDDVKICLVNNGSKDNTLEVLEAVKSEINTDISILDIKKDNGTNAAVKAGARFLFSIKDLKFILLIKPNMLTDFNDLENQLEILKKTEDTFKSKLKRNTKRKTLKEVYSYDDLLAI